MRAGDWGSAGQGGAAAREAGLGAELGPSREARSPAVGWRASAQRVSWVEVAVVAPQVS